MNSPTQAAARTLLEIRGATPDGRLADAVLLIIDAQRDYVDGALPLVGVAEALAVGGELLARARAAGTPVVHVLQRGAGALFNPNSVGFQPASPLVPQAGETVVEKTLANSFAQTNLQQVLAATGRTKLIVIGFMTHNCVSSTVRAATEHGYACTVVAPATATRDLPDGRGGTLAAAAVQAACLVGLSDTMAKIVWNAADIVE